MQVAGLSQSSYSPSAVLSRMVVSRMRVRGEAVAAVFRSVHNDVANPKMPQRIEAFKHVPSACFRTDPTVCEMARSRHT